MDNARIQRLRDRFNTIALVLPGQWIGLMTVFWMRFFPPLRPFNFTTSAPAILPFVICLLLSLLPFVLPKAYFRPRAFERGKFYPRLGIRWFRYFAPDGEFINQRLRRIDPSYQVVYNRAALRSHIQGTYSNERWHSAFFLSGLFTQIFAVMTGQYIWAVWLTITNIAFNLYPVMHQRYKRARLRNLEDL
jgi:hypothetical protein